MKRRDFIKASAPLAVVPFFSGKLLAAAMPSSILDTALVNMSAADDRILVIVQISGGNDGLNTVLPLDQYTNLATARANILIPQNQALVLGSSQTGLHPAMTGMADLFTQNKLSVIQSVSYGSPNFSHFRATDIFMSGSDSSTVLTSGWLGRWLEYAYPGFPEAYPNTQMPDPLSIAIGSSVNLGLQGYGISTAQTVPTNFSGSLTSLLPYTNSNNGTGNAAIEIDFLRDQQQYTNQYGANIVAAWNAGTNQVTYPTAPSGVNNQLAQQLRIVARLIKGGLKTRVYWVRAGGYDTHSGQVVAGNTTTGVHANLLKELSDSIAAFQNDLQQMGLGDRVLGMTFSEFGRRIISNGSTGTDHGSAFPMFLFGNKVKGGIVGTNPVIPANATASNNLAMQFDFHSIYQSILREWFCLSSTDAQSVLGYSAASLSAINTECSVVPVELVSFTAEKVNQTDAHLNWHTASENNTDGFEIERSVDGKTFSKIGFVEAKGHTHEPQRYAFLDKNLPLSTSRAFYYRLKIVDTDGSAAYSPTRSILFDKGIGKFAAEVAPNPAIGGKVRLILRGSVSADLPSEILVTDIYGRQVLNQVQYIGADNLLDLDLSATAAAGIYFVSVKHGAFASVQKVVLQ
jgi:uncharacterized protein (DUF1501 family)